MKERPIIFSASMVRAILNGTKTQTRRVVKPQPESRLIELVGNMLGFKKRHGGGFWLWPNAKDKIVSECPYGQPGDRLWVRETHLNWWKINPDNPSGSRIFSHVAAYAADGYELESGEKWIPSIHMLRAASRITLEITGIRLENLQDISGSDAKAEGVVEVAGYLEGIPACNEHRYAYEDLWLEINGRGSWDANPWVWVIEFNRIT